MRSNSGRGESRNNVRDPTMRERLVVLVAGGPSIVTWQVTANFANDGLTGNATTSVQITDFGMTPPKAGPVLSIEDELTLELNFAATREA